MKAALLDALQAARARKQPAVLVTDLASGDQSLLIGQDRFGDLILDPATLTEVTRTRTDDRSRTVEPDGNE